eukprot:gene2018-3088_t
MEGYKLKRHLGKGTGTHGVTLVESEMDKELCVVKRVDLALMSDEEQKKAVQECRLLMALRHPNIVKYRESVSTGRCQYTVMEYCPGGTLETCIAARRKSGQRPFEERQVLRWIAQLASALQYCHENHVLHRDIKAANCFLSSDNEEVLLGDFGISTVLAHTMAVAKTIIGSPCHMSPEVIEGRPYNQASDVWALGCLLFELSALRKPFESHNLSQLVQQVTADKPPTPPKSASRLVQKLITAMLEKDVAKRITLKELLALPHMQQALSDTPSKPDLANGGRPNGGGGGGGVFRANCAPSTAVNAHLNMNDWLKQHYSNLSVIQQYVRAVKKTDDQYIRSQLYEHKPKTPEISADRVLNNNKRATGLAAMADFDVRRDAQKENIGYDENKVKRRPASGDVCKRERDDDREGVKKRRPRLSMDDDALPRNARQAKEMREAEVAEKRARLAEEREARRVREKASKQEQEQERKLNAEQRKAAAQQRNDRWGGGGANNNNNNRHHNNSPPRAHRVPSDPAANAPTQLQQEQMALELKKQKILQQREERRMREAALDQKAEDERRQNADLRRQAAELRKKQGLGPRQAVG